MMNFSEWLLLEYWHNQPALNKIQILGWSLSTGTLPPWSYEHDEGLNPTSVFEGRSGPGLGGWEVYQASKYLRKERKDDTLNYLMDSIKKLRSAVRSKEPNRIRDMQYTFMTGKELKYEENAPEDFVAPDVGGGPDGRGSGTEPNGMSPTINPVKQPEQKSKEKALAKSNEKSQEEFDTKKADEYVNWAREEFKKGHSIDSIIKTARDHKISDSIINKIIVPGLRKKADEYVNWAREEFKKGHSIDSIIKTARDHKISDSIINKIIVPGLKK